MRLRGVGPILERAAEVRASFFRPSRFFQQDSQVVADLGEVRPQCEAEAKAELRLKPISFLLQALCVDKKDQIEVRSILN